MSISFLSFSLPWLVRQLSGRKARLKVFLDLRSVRILSHTSVDFLENLIVRYLKPNAAYCNTNADIDTHCAKTFCLIFLQIASLSQFCHTLFFYTNDFISRSNITKNKKNSVMLVDIDALITL